VRQLNIKAARLMVLNLFEVRLRAKDAGAVGLNESELNQKQYTKPRALKGAAAKVM